MHVGHIDVLDEVLIPRGAALYADPAPVLCTVFSKRGTLDVSEMGNGDDHIIVRIEVLRIEFLGRESYFGSPCVPELGLHLHRLLLDYLHLLVVASENLFAVGNEFHELVELILEFLPFKSGELAEPHFHDGRSLDLREVKSGHEFSPCIVDALRSPYDSDYLVDYIKGFQKTFQDMCPLPCLLQIELGPADYDFMPVVHKILYEFLQVERPRTAVHKSDIVDGETGLELGVLEEHVQHHIGVGILLQLDHDPDSVPCGLVIHIGYALYLLLLHKLGDLLDHLALVHHIRDLRHHYGLPSRLADLDVRP